MIKISILNMKGGVGKTATTVNLASCLSHIHNKRILVIDCDSQGDTTAFLTTSACIKPQKSVIELLTEDTVKECITPICFYAGQKEFKTNISLIASDERINSITMESKDDYLLLREKLKEVEDDYDYCFFDCHPALSTWEKSILCASDYVMIPAILDTDSLRGFDKITDMISAIKQSGLNANLSILGVLYTFVMNNATMDKLCKTMFDRGFNGLQFEANIRCALQSFKQSRHMALPIIYYKPIDYKKKPQLLLSTLTGDYIRLSNEVEERIKR